MSTRSRTSISDADKICHFCGEDAPQHSLSRRNGRNTRWEMEYLQPRVSEEAARDKSGHGEQLEDR